MKSNIAVIGMGVMGSCLALNMANHNFKVAVYNYTPDLTEAFVKNHPHDNITAFYDVKSLVEGMTRPRKFFIMVTAGKAVDSVIESLLPYLDKEDIIMDGGNSFFKDTQRRYEYVTSKGFKYFGVGVSGGEEGALNGPALMPGGNKESYKEIKEVLEAISAKAEDGKPCCTYIGENGAGHYVKMVHNGIEYGDMQLIAESYDLMQHLLGFSAAEMADIFTEWNKGELDSYLIEITANILRHKDKTGGYLIDKILDAAGQKGTGKWSVINAMELGMPLGLIATAVFERSLSAQKDLRRLASKQFQCQHTQPIYNKAELVKNIFSALYASKLVSYAQGFAVLQRASDAFDWHLDLASIARMWRGGCIIRSVFLNDIAAAFEAPDKPKHLLLAPYFREEIKTLLSGWKSLVAEAMKEELPVPAFSSALNYFYSLTSADLPANLVQAQRDYFGAHTFERKDELRGQFFHENWTGHGGDTKSGTYNV